jgi:hypothetical protein
VLCNDPVFQELIQDITKECNTSIINELNDIILTIRQQSSNETKRNIMAKIERLAKDFETYKFGQEQ